MSALFFSQTCALTEQIQHTTYRLQRIVDLVAKGSCQTSSSSQLFCGAQYLFRSFAMRRKKLPNLLKRVGMKVEVHYKHFEAEAYDDSWIHATRNRMIPLGRYGGAKASPHPGVYRRWV